MAQNPYLQNLLGIGPPLGNPMGLMRYEYTQPNYQNLLNQGLTASQIQGYDPKWATFGQFPYVMDQATNQVSVPGQAPGVDPIPTEEEQVSIDYSQTGGSGGGGGPSYVEEQQEKIKEDFPLGQKYAPTMSQFNEPMMLEWADEKGYVDKDGFLSGPMQTNIPQFSLMGNIMRNPLQMMNDRAYNNWLNRAREMGMFAEMAGKHGEPFGRIRISEKFKLQDKISNRMNSIIGGSLSVDESGRRNYTNTYAPNISNSDEIVYYTKTGGRYTKDGFVTGSNKKAAHGSMDDISQALKAAADLYNESKDLSGFESIPDKFLTQEYKNKIVGGADHLNDYKSVISSAITTYQDAGGKKVGKGSGGPGPKERSKLKTKPKQKEDFNYIVETAKQKKQIKQYKDTAQDRQEQRERDRGGATRSFTKTKYGKAY